MTAGVGYLLTTYLVTIGVFFAAGCTQRCGVIFRIGVLKRTGSVEGQPKALSP